MLELVVAAFAAFGCGRRMSAWPAVSSPLVTVAALIILLPGMSLTVAMTELATRNLIAGTARLMSAVIVLLQLVVGVALGERLAAALVVVHQATPVALPEWASWVALIALARHRRDGASAASRVRSGCRGVRGIGYVGSRLGTAWIGSRRWACSSARSQLGAMSNCYARWLDRPAQVLQVPAVLLLVPGSMGFRGMSSLLDKDTLSGVDTLFAMFVVAIAIVAGLLVANAVVSPRRSL